MSKDITISKLFSDAAKYMRAEFEFIRKSNPHPGEKGQEIENVLIEFLNIHLPKRFRAASGYLIDNDNNLSNQTDIIIYDAIASPVYRSSSKTQIVPADNVAIVIEVKTRLNKKELKDAFKNISSSKKLNKRPFGEIDQTSTGSPVENVSTFGVIFGFDTDTKLETLADSMNELMSSYDSNLWPDMLVILDKGVVDFAIQYPGENDFPGSLSFPYGNDFVIPPMYIHLAVHEDNEFTFNRFFLKVLTHLNFFPHRPSTPQFDQALKGASKQVMTICGYQYNLSRKLVPAPEEDYIEGSSVKLSIELITKPKKQISHKIGVLQYLNWQDGCVIRFFGNINLVDILQRLIPKERVTVIMNKENGYQISCVLNINVSEFKKWPEMINRNTKFKAKLVSIEDA